MLIDTRDVFLGDSKSYKVDNESLQSHVLICYLKEVFETVFCHVSQFGLKLLVFTDPLASASFFSHRVGQNPINLTQRTFFIFHTMRQKSFRLCEIQ